MTAIEDIRVHAPLVIAEGAILIFVCSAMVFLRFYARKVSGSSLGLDDLAVAAALVSLGSLIKTVCSKNHGLRYAIAVRGWDGYHSYCRFEILSGS